MTTFVLIPGAGGVAWYWHLVAERLTDAGHEAIAGFVNHGPIHVRGREGLVDVWFLPNPDNKKD